MLCSCKHPGPCCTRLCRTCRRLGSSFLRACCATCPASRPSWLPAPTATAVSRRASGPAPSRCRWAVMLLDGAAHIRYAPGGYTARCRRADASGGLVQVWGINNREAALRLIPDTGGRANCELKVGRSSRQVVHAIRACTELERDSKGNRLSVVGQGSANHLCSGSMALLRCADYGRHSQPAPGYRSRRDCGAAGPPARQQAAGPLPRQPRSTPRAGVKAALLLHCTSIVQFCRSAPYNSSF